MRTKKKIGGKRLVAVVLSFVIVTALCVLFAILTVQGAAPSVTVTFEDSKGGTLFETATRGASENLSGCITVPGPSFGETVAFQPGVVTADDETYLAADGRYYTFTGWQIKSSDVRLPAKTVFQPGDTVTPEVLAEYVSDGKLEFTAVWGKCYFAQNPYTTMVYKQENGAIIADPAKSSGATLASTSNNGFTPSTPMANLPSVFEAIRSETKKHEDDAYAWVLMLTGTLDYLMDNSDSKVGAVFGASRATSGSGPAGSAVYYTSATFKSLDPSDNDTVHTLYHKGKSYYANTYSNLRLDNIEFAAKNLTYTYMDNGVEKTATQNQTTEFQFYYYNGTAGKGTQLNLHHYVEITARVGTTKTPAYNTLRPANHELVVMNGGKISSLQISDRTPDKVGPHKEWFIGRNVQMSMLKCGTNSTNVANHGVDTSPYTVTITGGRITSRVVGGSSGVNTVLAGDRTFRIYGDRSGKDQSDPYISVLVGGAQTGKLYADIDILLKNCSQIGSIYGGGYDYTATTYGNISITLVNTKLTGNLFGGGYNANTEKVPEKYIEYSGSNPVVATEKSTELLFTSTSTANKLPATLPAKYAVVFDGDPETNYGGDVTIRLTEGSSVAGNIFGSGMGASQTVTRTDTEYSVNQWYRDPAVLQAMVDRANTPFDDFPAYMEEDDTFLVYKYGVFSWNAFHDTYLNYNIYSIYAYLSLATVENVYITVDASTVGTAPGNGKGNIYGGGSIAKVLGDTEITIRNGARVYGTVYGAGDGVATPGAVVVYSPVETPKHLASITIDSMVNGVPSAVTIVQPYPDASASGVSRATYQWSSDPSLRLTNGVDHTRKLIYSANTEGLGSVGGNTYVVIEGGEIKGSVFGGGNKGKVFGDSFVTVTGGTIVGEIYGGCNQADVDGDIMLSFEGGEASSVFGGNNQSGTVTGNIALTVSGGTITDLYGGGNQALYNGVPSVAVSGGTLAQVFGGGFSATVGGAVVAVSGGEITSIYGGGNLGASEGNISLTVSNGTVASLYGGANQADVDGDITVSFTGGEVTGGAFGANNRSGTVTGAISVAVSGGTVNALYGGGNQAAYSGTPSVTVSGGILTELYGGGLSASVGGGNVTLSGGTVEAAFGGGDLGNTEGNIQIRLSGTAAVNALYGGANQADVDGSIAVTLSGGSVGSAFGGNNASGTIAGGISVTATNAAITTLYGGGNQAAYNGTPAVLVSGGTLTELYGGGLSASVGGSSVTVSGGTVTGNLYGGGYQGNVTGDTFVTLSGGTVGGSVYGGGFAGTVRATEVTLDNGVSGNKVAVLGSVFGGGEGETATVYEKTSVRVALDYHFTANEIPITVTSQEAQSGEIKTVITETGDYSYIKGSVYGGGDLGMLGEGTINLSQNVATITKSASATVTVENGHILGSVFGGGNGIPASGVTYHLYMGAVFGKTRVNLYGGYVEGNLYGGGTQSRLYGVSSAERCAEVVIDETVLSRPIAVKGSVFGGGDRGNSVTANASVPTTVGNVSVTVKGNGAGSAIYFIEGGVYGDGNLCLVNGERTILMDGFTTGETGKLKTFYSLQRADAVTVKNSDFVLFGAIDLVEEGDLSVYSINRVDTVYFEDGSTVKLSQIVKVLENIVSDVMTDRVFIDRGHNGTNDYTSHGGGSPLGKLSDAEVEAIRNDPSQNVLCVANGLYLELKDALGNYGTVKGLFTLQLLYANPGEGGGYVYADIVTSTGDFICNTLRGYSYEPVSGLMPGDDVSHLYIRVPGEGYRLATGTYESSVMYYERRENVEDVYMLIEDTVGGKYVDEQYEYYYWYIKGSTIPYTVIIQGFIGAEETAFGETDIIPRHNERLSYVLFAITEGDDRILSKALKADKYELVQSALSLSGQEIAIEMMIGSTSVGFIAYDEINDVFSLVLTSPAAGQSAAISGYLGRSVDVQNNVILKHTATAGEDTVTFILHKANTVDSETLGMSLNVEIDLYTESLDAIFSQGTSMLIFRNTLSIVRLVPRQNLYSDKGKLYSGVPMSEIIRITGASAFTAEYQTKYIAMAFPSGMTWKLSTEGYRYYFNKEHGTYLTTDASGNIITHSPALDAAQLVKHTDDPVKGTYYTYPHDGDTAELLLESALSDSELPAGTKIMMIDLTNAEYDLPEYYYYYCDADTKEINLLDFLYMGTSTSIRNGTTLPYFMKLYEDKKDEATRVNERLAFVFDFSAVTWDDALDIFDGSVSLQHIHAGADIMDYVESTTVQSGNVDTLVYLRSAPKPSSFQVSPEHKGIASFDVESDGTMVDFGDTSFEIDITVSEDYVNTRFDEDHFSLKIELWDTVNGTAYKIPEGMYILYEGEAYYMGEGAKFIIIPIEDEGKHTFTVVNSLYSLLDHVGGNAVTVRTTLYCAPDAEHYNEYFTETSKLYLLSIEKEPVYSLKVSTDKGVYTKGERVSIRIETECTVPVNDRPTLGAMVKTPNGYVEIPLERLLLMREDGGYSILENAPGGTYRLVVTYGDKTEYCPLIVE